jgi:hypothetical protein
MARRFKTQGIKANKAYRVDELADAAFVTIPTVRNWLKSGMQRVDGNRPTMILGFQALDFLKARKESAKQPMALDEFFCMRCKAPRKALGAMADYIPMSQAGGRLTALCADCERVCNRNISAAQLLDVAKLLDVATKSSGEA